MSRGGIDRVGGIRCVTVEPYRGSYPDEAEPRWYRGEQQQQYADADSYGRFDTHGDEAGYRAPDPRGGGRMPQAAPPPGYGGPPVGPRSGEPLPPLPTDMPQRDQMQHPAAPRSRPSGSAPVSAAVDRDRRLGAGFAIWTGVIVFSFPLLRVLLDGAFGSTLSVGGVVSSVLALTALPLGALGLYGVVTGAAQVPGPSALHAWLRPPVAYLTVALILCVAAGLAAS
jgi:hypothetical protein